MKKILIVEDEANLVRLLKTRLEVFGYQVLSAEDGAKAFEKAKAEKPDLILLDVLIPIFNGYEVCKMLKEEASTKGIPVIMVTAKTTMGDVDEGFRAGADDYVTKPYEWNQLQAKIKKLIKG
jgi:DNA-binding response OmpR family regulator